MKPLCSLLLAVILAGCATSPDQRYSRLEFGMTQQQVINLLGPPKSTRYNGALTTLEYDLSRDPSVRGPAYVIIGREDGRVRSFGRN